MFMPLFALPVAAQLVLVADGMPTFDVSPSCRGAASAGYAADSKERVKTCIDSEQATRQKLADDWGTYSAADRAFCVSSIRGFEPTYTELATCLEMKIQLRNNRAPATVGSGVSR